jgi:uncharacterized membrane protein
VSSATSPEPGWGLPAKTLESRNPAQIAILFAAALNFVLPGKFTLGPPWFIPVIELLLLIPLFFVSHRRFTSHGTKMRQMAALALIGIVSVSNIISLILLIRILLFNSKGVNGVELIYSSVAIWVTNVLVFALWYWQLDRGGPDERVSPNHEEPDFLFPQMVTPTSAKPDWAPTFYDYLYVAFTNATAFSPTDTMPLTVTAKMLMLFQATASLATIAIVASRGIGIL